MGLSEGGAGVRFISEQKIPIRGTKIRAFSLAFLYITIVSFNNLQTVPFKHKYSLSCRGKGLICTELQCRGKGLICYRTTV